MIFASMAIASIISCRIYNKMLVPNPNPNKPPPSSTHL